MSLADIAADTAVAIPSDVTEAWRLAAARQPDTRLRLIPVLVPGRVVDIESQSIRHRSIGGSAVAAILPDARGAEFPLSPWAISPIPEYCAREDIALMVAFDRNKPFRWDELVTFARTYPRLAVVAIGAPLGGSAASMALDATANLVLDTSGADAEGRTPDLATTHGAHRVAYGSGPALASAAAVVAGLSVEEARMIHCGTAGHLAAGTWSSTFL